MLISYQCEDIDEREKDNEICKSWREVEVVAVAEQDRQTDEIACEKKQEMVLYLSLYFVCLCLCLCLCL